MGVVRLVVKNTDKPDVQKMLQILNPDEDVLVLAGGAEKSVDAGLKIQYIKPINELIDLGEIDAMDMQNLICEYGESISIEVSDYTITYENGNYGLMVTLDVNAVEEEAEGECEIVDQKTNISVVLCVVAAIFTGLATLVFFISKCMKRK